MQHGLEGSKKQKTTPRYIRHWGVSTPRYLGLFWIISKATIATPRYIGSWGVLTPRCPKHRGVFLKCL